MKLRSVYHKFRLNQAKPDSLLNNPETNYYWWKCVAKDPRYKDLPEIKLHLQVWQELAFPKRGTYGRTMR